MEYNPLTSILHYLLLELAHAFSQSGFLSTVGIGMSFFENIYDSIAE